MNEQNRLGKVVIYTSSGSNSDFTLSYQKKSPYHLTHWGFS